MRHITTILAVSALLGLSAPAQAGDWQQELQQELQQEMKRAEALAKKSIDEFGRAVNEVLGKLPRYGMPEMTPEGDIIIRRQPKRSPAPVKPESGPDIDETSA